jgi:hypothetical protein
MSYLLGGSFMPGTVSVVYDISGQDLARQPCAAGRWKMLQSALPGVTAPGTTLGTAAGQRAASLIAR